jgi:Mrp family chromosome partitioning ATPase
LVNLYFDKHLEVHRSIGAFAFVSEQSNAIQARLDETEARLKDLKLRSQVVSVAETSSSLHANLARREAELDAARAELAAQRARVEQFEGRTASLLEPPSTPDPNTISRYTAIIERIRALHRERAEMFSVFTPDSSHVKSNERQLEMLVAQKADLELRNPSLAQNGGRFGQPDSQHASWIAERATLSALEARIHTLEEQLGSVRAKAEKFIEVAPEMAQLERRKEAEAANQRYFESSLERARVDEALDPSKIPNISIVQHPSPASADYGRREAIAAGLAGGGLALGCGLAMTIGLLFDRTIKRASEIEEKARLAFLSSVPLFKQLASSNGRALPTSSMDALSPGKPTRLIQRHCEAIRDRLILGFELSGKTNMPKLVALTGCAKGAGTSTIAIGLAEALSRTGRGKVLLVDMNLLDRDSLNGHRATPVDDLLLNGSSVPPVAENLYVAIGTSVPAELRRPLAIQIRDLMPHLRKSDFDYVIIDLPSTDESSAALTSAGFVDKVVLVVPAEVVTPESLRRTYNELVSARGDVAIIFNRERNLIPQFFASNN